MKLKISILSLVFASIAITTTAQQTKNIGIGTVTPDPSSILHLNSSNQGFLMTRFSNGTIANIDTPIANGLLIYNTDETEFQYRADSVWTPVSQWKKKGDNIFNTNNGNVGIGTQQLARKLTLSRTTEDAIGQLELRTEGGISTGNFDGLYFTQGPDGNTPLGSFRVINQSSGLPDLGFYTRSGTTEVERMRILNNGNVGIGTANPSAKLHIDGHFGIGTMLNLFQSTPSWGSVGNFLAHRYIQTNSAATDGNFKQFNVGAGGVSIGYSNVPIYGSGDAMYVNGNVSIGTNNPGGYKLFVFGKSYLHDGIEIRNGNVDLDGGSGNYIGQYLMVGNNQAAPGATLDVEPIIPSLTNAALFRGNVVVQGTLSKGGGSFLIDHPLDPANKMLYHSFVESPDMMNVYNGNVTTDASGHATVELPDYFEALNKDFRYQLTVIGTFAQAIVEQEVAVNEFIIKTSEPNVKVSWQVTGIRKDAFAEKNRIPNTVEKSEEEKGKYVHPEVFGLPREASIYNVKQLPELANSGSVATKQ